jgi:hypothetical protein
MRDLRKYALGLGIATTLFAPWFAHAAEIYLDPATGKYPPGVTFGVDIRLNNQGQCINAATVDLSYPANILHAVSATDGNSIFTLWVKPPTVYSNYGLVSLAGGLPGGYCGRVPGDPSLSNKLATIYFQFPTSTASVSSSTLAQAARLVFLNTTQATLNDGLGSYASLTTSGATYSLAAIKGQYLPVNTLEGAIQNDTTLPEPFQVQVYRDPSLFNGQWFAVFSTVDNQTGIDHYDVAEVPPADLKLPQSQWNWARAISPYQIKDQSMNETIAVRAVDLAGNVRVETYMPTAAQTQKKTIWQSALPYLAVILVAGIGIIQLVFHIF